jgi:adenylylsulfate kinase-like enzyme
MVMEAEFLEVFVDTLLVSLKGLYAKARAGQISPGWIRGPSCLRRPDLVLDTTT